MKVTDKPSYKIRGMYVILGISAALLVYTYYCQFEETEKNRYKPRYSKEWSQLLATHLDSKALNGLNDYVNETLHETRVSLYVRMPGTEKYQKRFYCILYRSLVLFWPTSIPGKLVIVLDKESAQDHVFAEKLIRENKKQFPDREIQAVYEDLPNDRSILNFPGSPKLPGYNRQMWSSFFNDLYTDDPIIAWVDTDALFVSPVTLSDIYNGTRIQMVGHNKLQVSWVKSWAHSTKLALGYPMVVDFMTYFPLYLYRDTYTNCRNYILKRFKTTNFGVAFRKFYHGVISPSNIILSYAWYFERERYDWHFEIGTALDVYNKRLPKQHAILEGNTHPVPQTAFHAHGSIEDMRTGYCLTKAGQGLPHACQNYTKIDQHLNLYVYGFLTPETWCKGNVSRIYCLQLLNKRYKKAGEEVRREKRRMDWSDVGKVEQMATNVGIKCELNTLL